MELKDKVAVIYGAGGAIASTVATAFAREGARVYLSGPHVEKVERVAEAIATAGGFARTAQLDALDERAVDEHLGRVITQAGRVDISFNGISLPQRGIQGVWLTDLSTEAFLKPIELYMRSHFITARAAARRMGEQGAGVILINTPEVSRLGMQHVGGMASAWSAMEALMRNLSAELGPRGVRTVTIRSTGLPETPTIDVVYELHAQAMDIPKEGFLAFVEGMAHNRRQATLREVADAAIFAASDRASGMTGATLNITGGMVVDW